MEEIPEREKPPRQVRITYTYDNDIYWMKYIYIYICIFESSFLKFYSGGEIILKLKVRERVYSFKIILQYLEHINCRKRFCRI